MGVEMIARDSGYARHCCIEFRDGKPAGILTYDFLEHWQVNHEAAGLTARANLVGERFPSWSFQDWTPDGVFSASAIHNAATTGCDVVVSEGSVVVDEGSDRFFLQVC